MKIFLDDELVLELSQTQKKVLCNIIFEDDLREEVKRRLKYIIEHKHDSCMENLKFEWVTKLRDRGLKSIPLNDEEFAELVFKQEDYKGRSQREKKIPEKIDLDYFKDATM